MRACLVMLALMGVFTFAHAAESPDLKTNSVALGEPGTLQIVAPADWTMVPTNLNLPDHPITVEFHAPNKSLVIRLFIRWDGFGGSPAKPGEPEMSKIVSNTVAVQYLSVAVEKTIDLEKLRGSGVTGIFARITETNWSPMVKEESYPNLTEGMFRCGNIWGNFNVVTYDKDGPLFKQARKVLESMRRQP